MINHNIENKTFGILNDLNISSASEIDLARIAMGLGADLEPANLTADISGLFVIKDNKPYIRYNNSESFERQRFTIAHELGHFILHKDSPIFIDKNEGVFYRNQESSTGAILKEREANAFAAAILMPQPFIKEEISMVPQNTNIIDHLAKKFQVSAQAMSFRLSNLGYDFGLY